MTDILTAPAATTPQLVELIHERGQVPVRWLRPIEEGAPYYDLSRVEHLVETPGQLDAPADSSAREWRALGPVYLLGGTLQTLRWHASPVPATYHVGRVPEASSYRLMGEEHEYTLQALLDVLTQGPASFRGYPIVSEHRLQFTPPQADEPNSKSRDWEATTKWLRTGEASLRGGVHYQLYEVVTEQGGPTGQYLIGQLGEEGEWFTEYSQEEVAAVSSWVALLRPQVKEVA